MTERPPDLRCPNGHTVRAPAAFCPVCGALLSPPFETATGTAKSPGGPGPRGRRIWVAAFVAVIVVLGGVAIGTAFVRASREAPSTSTGPLPVPTGSSTGEPGTLSPTPEPTPTTGTSSPSPSGTRPGRRTVGAVDYTDATDSRAFDVARTFDAYFSGINTRTYELTRSVIDPQSAIDPGNSAGWSSFVHDVSTTTDSNIVLHSVATDPTGQGSVVADTTFTSAQAPGYGPAGSEQETCTDWNLTTMLTEPVPGEFLILESTGSHSPC